MAEFDEKVWAEVIAHEGTALGPAATADDLAGFEARHGLRLPVSYGEFLRRGNGGVVGVVRLFGVGRTDALDLGEQVVTMRSSIEATAEGPILPFASDWGGSYFCFDLRNQGADGECPVLRWNHEAAEEPDERPWLWSEFAPDFLSFVRRVIA